MRKWIVLLPLFLFTLLPLAVALEPVTADQLEHLLAQSHSLSDADLAVKLSNLELTERFSSARVEHWRSLLAGPRSQRALIALADKSEFLAPPASEIPAAPAPSIAEQRRIMGLAAAYVTKAIPQLPHFYATRAITYFEGDPAEEAGAASAGSVAVHATRITRDIVQYRDGQEVAAPLTKVSAPSVMQDEGLHTWGVFGPILSLVLLDAAQNQLSWERWEQGPLDSPVAVFRFSVPRERSHYQVSYCCTLSDYGMENHPFQEMTGYHGEMAIDPASGTILRLVIWADLKASDPMSRADIAVEYGPVMLGGVEYNCPLHSVSISVAPTVRSIPDGEGAVRQAMGPPQMLLNHADFASYHLFRVDTRILSAGEERSVGAAPDATLPAQTADAGSSQPAEEILTDGPAAKPGEVAASAAEAPEITASAAHGLPDQPLQVAAMPTQPEPTGYRLRINARLVDVNVVALDKKGQPITGLTRDDFEVYDNGVKQEIRSFSPATAPAPSPAAAPEPAAPAELPPLQEAFSNQHPAVAAQPSRGNTLVFLIDPSNLVYNDLVDVRQQMLSFLKKTPASDPVALYVMRYHGFQVMQEATTDHAKVATMLAKWTPTAQDLLNARDEENRNRQQFDTVHNLEDMLSVNGNFVLDTQTQGEALDPKLRELGSVPGPTALAILVNVANHLAPMPGHKSLVWITSDNALADWNYMSDTIEKHSRYIEPYALRTQEAMNNAEVSVYPLDASRLEGNAITADLANRNVQLTPTYQNPSQLPVQVQATVASMQYEQLGPEAKGADDADVIHPQAMARNFTSNNRLRAQMQQDLHPIEGVFREIADATGGHAFRRSSNVLGELNGVVQDGEATYLLGFTPAGPADGKYHLLTVKLLNHRGATVRYRTGYEYNKEPSTLKERFAKAVWQPDDVSEIGLSARPVVDSAGKALRVTISGVDLDLGQQNSAAAKQDQAKSGAAGTPAATAPAHEVWTGKLDIFLVQRSDEGMHAHVSGQTIGLNLRPATYRHALADGLTFDERLQSSPGVDSLRVIVVDVNSGRMGSVTVPTTAFTSQMAQTK